MEWETLYCPLMKNPDVISVLKQLARESLRLTLKKAEVKCLSSMQIKYFKM